MHLYMHDVSLSGRKKQLEIVLKNTHSHCAHKQMHQHMVKFKRAPLNVEQTRSQILKSQQNDEYPV